MAKRSSTGCAEIFEICRRLELIEERRYVYTNEFKSWVFGCAKAAQFTYRK